MSEKNGKIYEERFYVVYFVSGTPAVVLSNGTLVPGYQPPKEMKEFLDEHQKMTSGK